MEDGTRLLGDSQRQGWRIICPDLGVDTATIMGAGLYNMALKFAEIERQFIGKRTRAAMAKLGETKHLGRKRRRPERGWRGYKPGRGTVVSLHLVARQSPNVNVRPTVPAACSPRNGPRAQPVSGSAYGHSPLFPDTVAGSPRDIGLLSGIRDNTCTESQRRST